MTNAKEFSSKNWFVTLLLLVAAMVVPSAAWADEVTFTAKEGTAGFNDNESYGKLIDGKYTSEDGTKWCLNFTSNGSAYIIFSASEPIQVTGYSIVTGNDNASETGRNPKSWAIYGCNDASAGRSSESWVLIDEVTNDTKLQNVNYQQFDYTSLSNPPSEKYQYFKMEITAIHSGTVMQMSELILAYSTTCDHQWVKTGDVVDPTCTEGGYDVYECSVCQLTKNVANDNGALGHQWVDGTVVAPTCTKDGYTPQTCSRCHAEQKINIVNATGHEWGTDNLCDVCGAENSTPCKPQNGDGSPESPYQIGTVGELYWFAGLVNGDASVCTGDVSQKTDACAVLTANITVNEDVLDGNGNLLSNTSGFRNWTPIIGSNSSKYAGTFDGRGYTISGLYFNDTNTNYVGLFGYNSGTIKNVGVVDSYFKGNNFVGGVCGYNNRNGNTTTTTATITNCYYAGTVSVSGTDVNIFGGGICGFNDYGKITNCYNRGTVSENGSVGGVCGGNSGTIENSYHDSNIYTGDAVGKKYKPVSNVEGKTTAQFKSGEVCYLLNNGMTDGSQAWYQTLSGSGEEYPNLNKDAENKTVYAGYRHSETTPYCSNTQSNIPSDYGHLHAYKSDASDEANGNHDMSLALNDYNSYTWEDIDNYSNATAKCNFVCSVCNSEVAKDMTVTHNEERTNVPAKCMDKGHNYYVASLTFNGTTYTEYYTQEVPALGHDDSGALTFNSGESIYEKHCNRDGCDEVVGYYATSDGSLEATYEDGVYKVPNLCLDDGLAYDSKAQFTVEYLTYKRTFSHDKWVAVYVPFAIDCSQLPNFMEMAVVNNFHEYEQEDGSYNVVLEVKRKTSGTIPALTPCVMRLKEAPLGGRSETYSMPFSNAVFSPAADNYIDCASMERYYKFTGSLTGIEEYIFNEETDFVLNEGTLYKANPETTLKAQRWYLSAEDRAVSSNASVASLRSIAIQVVGESDVTGMEDIHVVTEKATSAREGIFDLQGRRLNSEPAEGVYIKNGIKYVK